jgi:hypothetical protein
LGELVRLKKLPMPLYGSVRRAHRSPQGTHFPSTEVS